MSDNWMERAQSAETKLITMKESMGASIERVKEFKKNFGIREKQDGSLDINFDKFAENLGAEGCLELRKVIDDMYQIKGAAGVKPRMKVVS